MEVFIALAVLAYLGIAILTGIYSVEDLDLPIGRSIARGALWPLILLRLIAVEAWNIVAGA